MISTDELTLLLAPHDPMTCPNERCKLAGMERKHGRHECPVCGFTNSNMLQAQTAHWMQLRYIPIVQELIEARDRIFGYQMAIDSLQTSIHELLARA